MIFNSLVPANQLQMNLFNQMDRERGKVVLDALDEINGTMGRGKLAYASCGTEQIWKTAARMRSTRYTMQ